MNDCIKIVYENICVLVFQQLKIKMADDAKPGPSEEGDDDSQIVEMLPGFKDVNAFSQVCMVKNNI